MTTSFRPLAPQALTLKLTAAPCACWTGVGTCWKDKALGARQGFLGAGPWRSYPSSAVKLFGVGRGTPGFSNLESESFIPLLPPVPSVLVFVSRAATNSQRGCLTLLLALVSPNVKWVGGVRKGLVAACL